MGSINERIKYIRSIYCEGNNIKFAQMLGKNANTTSNWVREGYSVGRGVAGEIADTFGISKHWLLTGEGNINAQGGSIIQKIGDGSNNNTQVAGSSEVARLKEKIKLLEQLLEEKERTIKILMNK